jgi:hypothetical protein
VGHVWLYAKGNELSLGRIASGVFYRGAKSRFVIYNVIGSQYQ